MEKENRFLLLWWYLKNILKGCCCVGAEGVDSIDSGQLVLLIIIRSCLETFRYLDAHRRRLSLRSMDNTLMCLFNASSIRLVHTHMLNTSESAFIERTVQLWKVPRISISILFSKFSNFINMLPMQAKNNSLDELKILARCDNLCHHHQKPF